MDLRCDDLPLESSRYYDIRRHSTTIRHRCEFHEWRQEVLDRSITAIGSGVPTPETVISEHQQIFGKSLATNIDQERLLGDIKVQ
jgi:hypothetical protein